MFHYAKRIYTFNVPDGRVDVRANSDLEAWVEIVRTQQYYAEHRRYPITLREVYTPPIIFGCTIRAETETGKWHVDYYDTYAEWLDYACQWCDMFDTFRDAVEWVHYYYPKALTRWEADIRDFNMLLTGDKHHLCAADCFSFSDDS